MQYIQINITKKESDISFKLLLHETKLKTSALYIWNYEWFQLEYTQYTFISPCKILPLLSYSIVQYLHIKQFALVQFLYHCKLHNLLNWIDWYILSRRKGKLQCRCKYWAKYHCWKISIFPHGLTKKFLSFEFSNIKFKDEN